MAAANLGRSSWSAGRTAATDPRLAAMAAKNRGRIRGPYKTVNGRPRSETMTCPVLPMPSESESDYAYLLGLYLGDGHIAKMRRTWVLRIYLDKRQPNIIERCLSAVARVNPYHKVGRQTRPSVTIVRSYGECWLSLFPQHGAGRKHERPIVLAEWQREIVERWPRPFMRGLIESDGCRYDRMVNGVAYPAYEFTNRSVDILALFCWTCDLLDVHYTRPSPFDVSIARRADVARLDAFIGPKG